MGFTEKKYSLLSKFNKIKKIIWAIESDLGNLVTNNSINELITWYNRYEDSFIEIPKTIYEKKILKEKLCQQIEDFSEYSINNIMDYQNQRRIEGFEVLLDNLRSPYNVGSIIRNCDCFGVSKVYLSGITPNMYNSKVKRISMNSKINVENIDNTIKHIIESKKKGYKIISIEKTVKSQSIEEFFPIKPILLVYGNEEFGLDDEIIRDSDYVIHIPNFNKNSFNVSVSSGISLWEISKKLYKY